MTDDEPRTRSRPSTRLVLVVTAAAIVAVGAVQGWRWRADRAYVGTEVDASIQWGECLNGIHWTDPGTGVGWWAGDSLEMTPPLESEPPELRPSELTPSPGMPTHVVTWRATGTMRFERYDRALFTNRLGGTLAFQRTEPGQMYTAQCGVRSPGPESLPASIVVPTAPTTAR